MHVWLIVVCIVQCQILAEAVGLASCDVFVRAQNSIGMRSGSSHISPDYKWIRMLETTTGMQIVLDLRSETTCGLMTRITARAVATRQCWWRKEMHSRSYSNSNSQMRSSIARTPSVVQRLTCATLSIPLHCFLQGAPHTPHALHNLLRECEAQLCKSHERKRQRYRGMLWKLMDDLLSHIFNFLL